MGARRQGLQVHPVLKEVAVSNANPLLLSTPPTWEEWKALYPDISDLRLSQLIHGACGHPLTLALQLPGGECEGPIMWVCLFSEMHRREVGPPVSLIWALEILKAERTTTDDKETR